VNVINESQRAAARVAGIAFLFTDATATFAQFYVRPTLIVQNNAAQTAANVMASEWLFRLGIAIQLTMIAGLLVLTAALYVVLSPIGPGLALLGALWRLTENAVLAVGTLTSLNVLGLLSGAASALTFIVLPNLANFAQPWCYAPLLIFELGTALWLLIRGLPQLYESGLEAS